MNYELDDMKLDNIRFSIFFLSWVILNLIQMEKWRRPLIMVATSFPSGEIPRSEPSWYVLDSAVLAMFSTSGTLPKTGTPRDAI